MAKLMLFDIKFWLGLLIINDVKFIIRNIFLPALQFYCILHVISENVPEYANPEMQSRFPDRKKIVSGPNKYPFREFGLLWVHVLEMVSFLFPFAPKVSFFE